MKLKVVPFGVALGIVWGLGVFLMGIMAKLSWGITCVTVLSSMYFGYKATLVGSLIGAAWGFIDAFIGGIVFAWLYNKISKS